MLSASAWHDNGDGFEVEDPLSQFEHHNKSMHSLQRQKSAAVARRLAVVPHLEPTRRSVDAVRTRSASRRPAIGLSDSVSQSRAPAHPTACGPILRRSSGPNFSKFRSRSRSPAHPMLAPWDKPQKRAVSNTGEIPVA